MPPIRCENLLVIMGMLKILNNVHSDCKLVTSQSRVRVSMINANLVDFLIVQDICLVVIMLHAFISLFFPNFHPFILQDLLHFQAEWKTLRIMVS